jgi:hypothetical protein
VRELKLTMAMNSKEDKVTLSSLYDRIETQLRALETLGVAMEKYAAMLFPLVESYLSEVLRAWQHSSYVSYSLSPKWRDQAGELDELLEECSRK